ncbi:hypothetical protein ALQ26_200083 [Pseudomonas amygdali pv. lachrymans]|nr:hypothetical protein ALQ26_200083 [Pseudomonas amygdali pv. lachrymans]
MALESFTGDSFVNPPNEKSPSMNEELVGGGGVSSNERVQRAQYRALNGGFSILLLGGGGCL